MDMLCDNAVMNSSDRPTMPLVRRSKMEDRSVHSSPNLPRKTTPLATKVGQAIKEYGPLALGALALELVIMFSFRSNDGLFLIIPTLAIGTSVYMLDGRKK